MNFGFFSGWLNTHICVTLRYVEGVYEGWGRWGCYETGTLLLGKFRDGGLEGVEVTSTSTSESSESKGFVSVLMTRGSGQSEWVCWISEWCWWKGRTWKRIGWCMALFQQGEGVDSSDDGGGVISSPHPGLVLLKRWSSTAACCCSRWNMTASRSRSAKAKRLIQRKLKHIFSNLD